MANKILIAKLTEYLLKIENEIVCLHPEDKIAKDIFNFLDREGYIVVNKKALFFRLGSIE